MIMKRRLWSVLIGQYDVVKQEARSVRLRCWFFFLLLKRLLLSFFSQIISQLFLRCCDVYLPTVLIMTGPCQQGAI